MVKVYEHVIGRNLQCYEQFKDRISRRTRIQQESLNGCEFILALVTITSRVGTDIEAAFKVIPEGKPVILVVFHHTFQADYVVPDCRRFINRQYVKVYNMLFHETEDGLLRCLKNDEELKRISDWLIENGSEPLIPVPSSSSNDKTWVRWSVVAFVVFVGIVAVGLIIWGATKEHQN